MRGGSVRSSTKHDLEAAIEVTHLAQPGGDDVVIELGGLGEDLAVGPEGDRGPGVLLPGPELFDLAPRLAPFEALRPDETVAPHFGVEALGQGVDHRNPDTMEARRRRYRPLARTCRRHGGCPAPWSAPTACVFG